MMGDRLQRLIWAGLAAVAMAAFGLRTPPPSLSFPPPSGTVLAQLGAYESLDEAASAWTDIRAKAPDLLAAMRPVILKVEWNGPDYFRLRTVMADIPSARTFCAALLGLDISCIPVTQR